MKKKVVAILASRVAYGKERSNIEVYHLLQNSGLYDMTVLVSNQSQQRIYDLLGDLNFVKLPFPDRHLTSFLKYLIDLIRINIILTRFFFRNKPDVVFINNELTIYDLFISLYIYKGKIVYRIGDAPAYPNLRFYFANSRMWKYFCVKRVDTFVYISDYIRKTVETTGRSSIKDKTIYNYPPARNTITNKLSIRKDEKILTFGYIGQIFKQKGVDLFVDAAKKILAMGYVCHFYIAGGLKFDKEFGDLIKEMTLGESHIDLLDEVEDIETFYSNIDVLVVPSVKEEPLGNILVEAKKYHRPCVIFPSGGMPELITHKVDGFVCKNKTVDALFEGLKYYLDNSTVLNDHKQASFDSIVKLNIDRKTFETKWLEVFEKA